MDFPDLLSPTETGTFINDVISSSLGEAAVKLIGDQVKAAQTTGESNFTNSTVGLVEAIAQGVDASAKVLTADSSAPSAGTTTATELSSDERLQAQCVLIDFIEQISEKNKISRYDKTNKDFLGGGGVGNYTTIGMEGDGEKFSSFINGNEIKSKFLDFTTAQISSLVPNIKIYKIASESEGITRDYIVPFPTHAAWSDAKTNTGEFTSFNTNFKNVGIKSVNWTFEGSNPVSARTDIKFKIVLFAKSLTDLIQPFKIYDSSGNEHDFKYVDLILRQNYNPSKEFDASYYRIKVQIGWKTENTDLFDETEIECLQKNTTTMFLTLADHEFDFEQDGTIKLTMSYYSYYESLLGSENGDFLRTADQQRQIDEARAKIQNLKNELNEKVESAEDTPTENIEGYSDLKKQYDDAMANFNNTLLSVNKDSFKSIIQELQRKGVIKYCQVDVAQYGAYKLVPDSIDVSKILSLNPTPTTTQTKIKEISEIFDKEGKPDLTNLLPEEVDGKKIIPYFFLGDLLYLAIQRMYNKMDAFADGNNVNKPKFLFGTARYINRGNSDIKYVNLLDIPISVEWFTEWFTANVVMQDKDVYPLLFFFSDLCTKVVSSIMSITCAGDNKILRNKNKFNRVNFNIVKNGQSEASDELLIAKDNLYVYNSELPSFASDLPVDEIKEIISDNSINSNEEVDFNNIQEYIVLYCQDRTAPATVDCEEDQKNGIYHFYFGKDRGIVKKINFKRTQTIGYREANYIRNSNGLGLQQLMTPYDVDISMIGNNLMYNGMMIYVDPSGFGRNIGSPSDPNSVSYQLKLGGYHTVYRVECSFGVNGFETNIKSKWVGSGASSVAGTIITPQSG